MFFLKKLVFLILLSFVCFFTSCDNDACKENMYTPMTVSFFFRNYPSQSYYLDTFSVKKVDENGDLVSIGYEDTFAVTTLKLSLNPNYAETKFFFKSQTFRDTLVVRHTNTSEYVSAECGARNVFRIDSVFFADGHADDSISISNPVVNGVYNAQNVKIYME